MGKVKHWHNTAYGQRYAHYFKEGNLTPLCGSDAIFTPTKPFTEYENFKYFSCYTPKGRICKICQSKLNKLSVPSKAQESEENR